MAIAKGKIDGGQGGKLGHSNMAHWVYSHELKDASRKARRLDAKAAIRSGLAEHREPAVRRAPRGAASGVSHPNADQFPAGLPGPALRALHRAGLRSLAEVASWSSEDLASLHGIGPKALATLKRAAKSPASAINAADARGRVRAYFDALPPEARRVLARMRAAIRSAVPGGEEGFSYGIPCIKRDGRVVVWFAAWKTHLSLYPIGPGITSGMHDALAAYPLSKGTIRFPISNPPSAVLVRRMVKARLILLGAAHAAHRPRSRDTAQRVR